jgi:hypothetical protein
MDPETERILLGTLAAAVVTIPIAMVVWSGKRQQIGTIRCRRCNQTGPAKGQWTPFHGIKPVCQKCDSEDWVASDQ